MQRLTIPQSEKVLERAAVTLDHFPSIAQLAMLTDEMQKNAPGGSGKISRIIPRECNSCMGDGLLFLEDSSFYRCVFSCDKCRNGDIQREISGERAPHISVGIGRGYMRIQRATPLKTE